MERCTADLLNAFKDMPIESAVDNERLNSAMVLIVADRNNQEMETGDSLRKNLTDYRASDMRWNGGALDPIHQTN